MFNVVLHQPQIPPNTGNIIRLCANAGCALHLIEPLGFSLDHSRLRRAGFDYHEFASLRVHTSVQHWLDACAPARVFAFTTRGSSSSYHAHFAPGDSLLIGSENIGSPADVRERWPASQRLSHPLRWANCSRTLSPTL